MGYQFSAMADPTALFIVLAGTVLATIARCGLSDLRVALNALAKLGSKGFDADANRMALAPAINEIQRRGALCTDIPTPPDPSLARVLTAFARTGALSQMHTVRASERRARENTLGRAVRTFEYAGELAPVFGLVGTLFAITQLAPLAGDGPLESTMASIATAVLSSLYGVLTAHLIWNPFARAIERKGQREEAQREDLIEWLDTNLQTGLKAGPLGRKASPSHRARTVRDAA